MALYIPDTHSKRWVIISPTRNDRPHDKKEHTHRCPFCTGNEADTPPEIQRFGNGTPNTPGWSIRVVPNKYQITDIHEVIIHSPHHTDDLIELPTPQVQQIFQMYQQRYRVHLNCGNVLIFSNHGPEAGASLTHPHSQLVVIPQQILLDVLTTEPVENQIAESDSLIAYCPNFSQWPYEVWIAPKKKEEKLFVDASEQDVNNLAEMTQEMLRKMGKILSKQSSAISSQPLNILSSPPTTDNRQLTTNFSYNYYISPTKPWYLRIIPRTITRAGFELGTGLSVNPIEPKVAAEKLKN